MERIYMVSWQHDLMCYAVADMEIPDGVPLPEPVQFEYRAECGKRMDNFYAEIYDKTYAEIYAEKENRARKFMRSHEDRNGRFVDKDYHKGYFDRKSYKQDSHCGNSHIKHMRNSSAEKSIRDDYIAEKKSIAEDLMLEKFMDMVNMERLRKLNEWLKYA